MAEQQAMLQEMITAATLQQISQQEAQVDEAMSKLDQMDKEELEEMAIIRERRMQHMRNAKARKQIGHGELTEIGGSGNEKDFFDAAKQSPKMVCHFFRGSSPRCEIMNMHLGKLARQHPDTRFVMINAETSPFLTQRLRIIFMPTVCIVLKGKVTDYIVGFDDMGGVDDFDTEVLEWRLGVAHAIEYQGSLDGPGAAAKTSSGFIGGTNSRKQRYTKAGMEDDSDSDF